MVKNKVQLLTTPVIYTLKKKSQIHSLIIKIEEESKCEDSDAEEYKNVKLKDII